METFTEKMIQDIRREIGQDQVVCALTGSLASTVAAACISRAIGNQLTCLFVDHGLLRAGKREEVERLFGRNGIFRTNLIRVDVQSRFFDLLRKVTDPEEKRRKIRNEMECVLEEYVRFSLLFRKVCSGKDLLHRSVRCPMKKSGRQVWIWGFRLLLSMHSHFRKLVWL